MDDELRRLERLKNASGQWSDVLRWRRALKKSGGGEGLDLSLPHQWDVVGSDDSTYGQALVALRGLCEEDNGLHPFARGVARPLTFKETIQARVDQFEHEGAASLWAGLLDTCTAIVCEASSTKFRIVTISDDLLRNVPASFRNAFLRVNYSDFTGFAELDVQDGDDVYNHPLTQEQVLSHKAWLAAVEGDKKLLKRYSDIIFGEVNVAMGFYTTHMIGRQEQWVGPSQTELWMLSPLAQRGNYDCNGGRYLSRGGFFARVRPLN